MLEVVCAIAGAFGFIMGAAALYRSERGWDMVQDLLTSDHKLRSRIAELEARADANCENVRNQGEILAEHREALDAIAERLPKPRTPRKRKPNARNSPAEALEVLDATPRGDTGVTPADLG